MLARDLLLEGFARYWFLGEWVLYKTFNPSQAPVEMASKVPETKVSKMIKYVKTAAMTIVELGAIIAGMQGI